MGRRVAVAIRTRRPPRPQTKRQNRAFRFYRLRSTRYVVRRRPMRTAVEYY